jgi:hypothetical protein
VPLKALFFSIDLQNRRGKEETGRKLVLRGKREYWNITKSKRNVIYVSME